MKAEVSLLTLVVCTKPRTASWKICVTLFREGSTKGELPNEKLINECVLEEVLCVLYPSWALIRNVCSLPYLLYLTVITGLDISCSSLQC